MNTTDPRQPDSPGPAGELAANVMTLADAIVTIRDYTQRIGEEIDAWDREQTASAILGKDAGELALALHDLSVAQREALELTTATAKHWNNKTSAVVRWYQGGEGN